VHSRACGACACWTRCYFSVVECSYSYLTPYCFSFVPTLPHLGVKRDIKLHQGQIVKFKEMHQLPGPKFQRSFTAQILLAMMLLPGSGLCSAMKPMIQDAVGTDNPAPRFCWRAVRKKILTAEFASQVFSFRHAWQLKFWTLSNSHGNAR
jgi:hypothetical protein